MLRLFWKNTIVQVAVILAAMLFMWIPALSQMHPMAPAIGYAPLYTPLYNLSIPPMVATIAAMTLVLFGGLYLNLMLANTGLVSQNSLLPTLLYAVFMSATATSLSPMLLANLITLAILHMLLLHGSSLTIPTDRIFGAAALISIASMLYLPMLTLVIAYLLVAINYRLYNWREWMVLLLGLLAPYLLLWSILFLTGGLSDSLSKTIDGLSDIGISISAPPTFPILANLMLAAILVISIVSLWHRLGEKTVVWKKNAITTILPAVSGLAILLYSRLFPVNLQFFALPFAFCGTQMLAAGRHRLGRPNRQWKVWVNDVLLILIIACAVIC